jgi:hypothetical protein
VTVPPPPVAAKPSAPGPDADQIAAAVQACPLVAGLHGGAFGEVATYRPGHRVPGIRVTDDEAEIHVVGRFPATMSQIAGQVRDAAALLVGMLPIHVTIEDIVLPGEPVPGESTAGPPAHRRPSSALPVHPPATHPPPLIPPQSIRSSRS